MISNLELIILNHIPLNILELSIYNGWTIYDILEKIFC